MIELGYFAALGVILVFSHGMADDAHVPALVALTVALGIALFSKADDSALATMKPAARNTALGVVLVVFTLFLAHGTEMLYAARGAKLDALVDDLHWLPVAAVLALVGSTLSRSVMGRAAGLFAAGAVILTLIWARWQVLETSTHPAIDVWTSSQRAVDYFLEGKNPYTQSYVDIYHGRYDYFPSFPYLPAYLYAATAGVWLVPSLHDVRVSLFASEIVVAAFLFLIARRENLSLLTCALVVCVWLALPVCLFILEQAWIDSLLLVGFAGAAWALSSKRVVAAGVFLGLSCATKQYAVLGVSFFYVYAWRALGLRAAVKLVVSSALVTTAFMLPFAVLDLRQFLKYTLMSWGGALPRTDSLSLPAYLAHKHPPHGDDELRALYHPFAFVQGAVWLGTLAWLAWQHRPTLRQLFGAIGFATAIVLMVAKQAFCNYYYFMSFFVFVAMILRPSRRLQSSSTESS